MSTPTKTQLINGSFQDSEGNVLSNGTLVFVLNQDNTITGVGNICSGISLTVTLDSNGNVSGTQSIWATDVMNVANSYYTVTGYAANGQPAWGPNNQQVTSGGVGGGTFNLNTWTPNVVFSWSPSPQSLLLETNGTHNGSQVTLNLAAGLNISQTDNGTGTVTTALALSAAPATSSSAGTAGQLAFDGTHIYVCVATNTWVRAVLSTF